MRDRKLYINTVCCKDYLITYSFSLSLFPKHITNTRNREERASYLRKKTMGNQMGLTGSLVVVIVLLIGATATKAAEYKVGDNLGWTFPPNQSYYSDWAANKTFFVGDKLIFKWTGTHTVGDVLKEDYDSCNTKASAFASNGNETVFQVSLLHTGPRYFICTVDEHCLKGGMKFSINVESQSSEAASPSAPTLQSFGVFFSRLLSTIALYFFIQVDASCS